jgi:nucleoside-diphosphate-sugar epimerase
MKTVLITGAAGNVGSQLRSEFAGRYKLRLSDKRLLRPSAGNVEVGPAINTNTKLTLLVFIVFFLALALAALWML